MKKYTFHSRTDVTKETISTTIAMSRLGAAKYFAAIKRFSLKEFLKLYSVSK
jgi:hypothetical protein